MDTNNHTEFLKSLKALPNNNVIYGLCDPISNKIRYIGKAVDLYTRIRNHYKESRLKYITHKNTWIKSLLKKDLRVKVIILEEVINEDLLNEAEIKWIKYYREIGSDLTNGTDGGDGGKMSTESIAKMAEKKRGKKHSEEHKRNISKGNLNRVVSDETRDKIGFKHKNKIVSDVTRLKQREARLNFLKNKIN